MYQLNLIGITVLKTIQFPLFYILICLIGTVFGYFTVPESAYIDKPEAEKIMVMASLGTISLMFLVGLLLVIYSGIKDIYEETKKEYPKPQAKMTVISTPTAMPPTIPPAIPIRKRRSAKKHKNKPVRSILLKRKSCKKTTHAARVRIHQKVQVNI